MKFKKVILITLLLLAILTIGAVSAIEHNSTDEFLSVEQNDEISIIENNTEVISVIENNTEVLSAENNNTVISVNKNNSDILSAEDNNIVISVSGNDSEVLSIENNGDRVLAFSGNGSEVLSIENSNDEVLTVSNDDSVLSSGPAGIFYKNYGTIKVSEYYKTFYVGKMTIPYNKKYENGHKPSKKNKKAWKKYKNYLKSQKKAVKKFNKQSKKRLKQLKKTMKRGHWKYPSIHYKIKKYSKKWVVTYYINCMRHYDYNLVTKTGWWE